MGVLGAMQSTHDGANDWIERIVGRGWGNLNLHSATALLDQGQASVNLVAAIPSLHAGMTAAVSMFLWNRVHRGWRPLLVIYPLIMAFTLVYTAEHYVIDILLGLGARRRGDPCRSTATRRDEGRPWRVCRARCPIRDLIRAWLLSRAATGSTTRWTATDPLCC